MKTTTAPKLRDRLHALARKRDALNMRIHDELRRPAPCTLRLQTLKRMRLRLKDQVGLVVQQLRRPMSGSPDAA